MSQRIPEIDMLHDTPAPFLNGSRPVKIVAKASQGAIIPDRRAVALKRIDDMKSEIGRLSRLLDELRADLLHVTIE